jgi:hypothetical protein
MYDFTLACFERALQLADDQTSADVWCVAPKRALFNARTDLGAKVQHFAFGCRNGRHDDGKASAHVRTRLFRAKIMPACRFAVVVSSSLATRIKRIHCPSCSRIPDIFIRRVATSIDTSHAVSNCASWHNCRRNMRTRSNKNHQQHAATQKCDIACLGISEQPGRVGAEAGQEGRGA